MVKRLGYIGILSVAVATATTSGIAANAATDGDSAVPVVTALPSPLVTAKSTPFSTAKPTVAPVVSPVPSAAPEPVLTASPKPSPAVGSAGDKDGGGKDDAGAGTTPAVTPTPVATPKPTVTPTPSPSPTAAPVAAIGGKGSGPVVAASEAVAAAVTVVAAPLNVGSTPAAAALENIATSTADTAGTVLDAAIGVAATVAQSKNPAEAVSGAAVAAGSIVMDQNGAVSKALYASLYPSPANTSGWAITGLSLIAAGLLWLVVPAYQPTRRKRRSVQSVTTPVSTTVLAD